jgi:hypothetical protein
MTRIIFILLLLTTTFSLKGQVSLLEDFDFSKGGYYLIGIRSMSDPNGLADTLGEFYTNDIETLNQIKKEWTFKIPGKQYACGYHYFIHICKDGKSLESFAVNLNCNEIVGKKGYFFFDNKNLRQFKDNFKTLNGKYKEYIDLKQARAKRDSLLQNKNILLVQAPIWTKYEGRFRFTFTCNSNTKMCLTKGDKILPKLKIEIQQKFPNEIFEITDVGGSRSELFVEVLCNKTLSDKFNLYKRDTSPDSLDEWTPFTYGLAWYWADK